MMDTMTTEPLTDVIPPLNAHDRCDREPCGAQAYVAVLLNAEQVHPLLFCGHHARESMPAILARHPFAVRDDIKVLAAQS